MDKQYVRMMFHQNDGFDWVATSAWDVTVPAKSKKFGRFGFLQKWCWWFLNRTGCVKQHFDKNQLVKSVVIDKDKAATEIIRLAEDQLSRFRSERPKKILMGGEQFRSLLNEPSIQNMQRFSFDVQFSQSRPRREDEPYSTGTTVFNVPVDVIPWMDGVLVL